MITTKLLGALLLHLAAGMQEDNRSLQQRQQDRQRALSQAAQAPPETSCCMVITGLGVLCCDSTVGALVRGGVAGCHKVAECAHGCWMAIPENCVSKCADGTVACLQDTGTCCTGAVVWVGYDCLYQGCAQQCCWETLAKACCYETCFKGCVVPLTNYCASGKCCTDMGACASACAEGTVACAGGCKDLSVCLVSGCVEGCGTCATNSCSLLVKCGQGCGSCVKTCVVRCCTPEEWANCARYTINCGHEVCCGLMTCCRDEICCYQQWWTREQCFNGAVACAQGTVNCAWCIGHLPYDCYMCLPKCADVITCCSAAFSGCAQSCGKIMIDCNDCCNACVVDLQDKGKACMESCGHGLCVSLPANAHAGVSRTMAFLSTTGPMRMGHAVTQNLPRQVTWAGMAGRTDAAWASAIGASAGDNVWARNPNQLLRNVRHWNEDQVSAFMTAYFVKLDNKWATNQAWTAFWRGDADMEYTGRNQLLAEYKNEFRRRYNLAMCVYMDEGWYKSWSEHYPSYREKYMADLIANGTITAAEMTDEQFEARGRYLMSTEEQTREFQRLVRIYNGQFHEARDEARAAIATRIGGVDHDARQEMREVTPATRLVHLRQQTAARVAVPAPHRAPEASHQELRAQLQAPLLGQQREVQITGSDHWTCSTCHRRNHHVYNPTFCGNEDCPTNA